MLSIKDPVILYWLHTSGLLQTIRLNLQQKLSVDISLHIMRLKSQGQTSTLEVIKEFNKEIEQEISSFKIQSLDIQEETYQSSLKAATDKYSPDKLTIINLETQASDIKNLIRQSKIPNGISEFQNYYNLQNIVYIFARWNIADDVLAMFTKNDFNDSLNEETTVYCNKPDTKLEELEIEGKLAEFEGGELWSCTYKRIPHTYIKFRDSSWEMGLKKVMLHTSHPKLLPGLSLSPPLTKLKPSKDKLPQLLSFLGLLQRKYPSHYPTIDSMFESSGKLVIFSKENNYRINKGWLCYRVVYGEISYQGYLRWSKHNPGDEVSKHNTGVEQHFELDSL